MSAMVAAASYDNWAALGIGVLTIVYLLIVLIFPERF